MKIKECFGTKDLDKVKQICKLCPYRLACKIVLRRRNKDLITKELIQKYIN
jgi:hypothetical protein